MARSGGIRWRGDNIANYGEHLRGLKADMMDDLVNDLDIIGEYAATRLRERIATSGTETRPEGRVETGRMHDTVSHDLVREGDTIKMRFGWPETGVPYVRFQDLGTRDFYDRRVDAFNKPPDQVGIPGMFALLDTFIETRDNMRERGM